MAAGCPDICQPFELYAGIYQKRCFEHPVFGKLDTRLERRCRANRMRDFPTRHVSGGEVARAALASNAPPVEEYLLLVRFGGRGEFGACSRRCQRLLGRTGTGTALSDGLWH